MKWEYLILVILILGIISLNVKAPLCYPGKEKTDITFVTYEGEIVDEIKEDLRKNPLYIMNVNGESMKPSINHNDECLCVPQKDYYVGDIIAFFIPINGKVELIGHRITAKSNDIFKTRGDNNKYEDSFELEKEQIFCKIPEKNLLEKFKFVIFDEVNIDLNTCDG